MTWRVERGDCVEVMAGMPEASVDAVVCDPPYALGFMGKGWDSFGGEREAGARGGAGDKGVLPGYGRGGTSEDRFAYRQREARAFQHWCEAWATEALRVLKPGGHLLAFGGTRTYHRLACAIEDAGFEVRDCLAWLYGSGFPKSLDVSKAIDKAAGAEREPDDYTGANGLNEVYGANMGGGHTLSRGAPATPDAERWQGWGTALKPAHEPIVLARKPLAGTVAGNVLAHGVGALNVDGCRIGYEAGGSLASNPSLRESVTGGNGGHVIATEADSREMEPHEAGRWPANVLLDPAAAQLLDEQTGELTSGANPTRRGSDKFRDAYGEFRGQEECTPARGADSGGASRFFYVAKASSAERNAGLDGFEAQWAPTMNGGIGGLPHDEDVATPKRNVHPTVKPIELMRWLVRLVTPPGGAVIDPFTGSGTTGCAAVLEGFEFVGIEREPEYADIAEARIRWWAAHPEGVELVRRLELEGERKRAAAAGQGSLLDLLDGEAA